MTGTRATRIAHKRTVVALLLALAGCSGGDDAAAPVPGTTTAPPPAPAPATTIIPAPPADQGVFVVGDAGAALLAGPGGAPTGRIRAGVVLPYSRRDERFALVTTPCDNEAWVDLSDGTATGPYRVVVDPGHGGDEPGAVGPGGLTEAEVNLDVGRRVVERLADEGVPAVLTRTDDYRVTLKTRVQVAIDAAAEVFVSVHHNAEPDEQRATPGSEAFYQYRSADSKRLTGLLYEEVFRTYGGYPITFAADFDAGAKYRITEDQRDYYGVIRRTFEAGIAATLLESGFISNPEEEALLRRADVRRREGEAVARAILRYFDGDEPGEVFTEPYPRTQPAGPGGGAAGCEEPA